MDPRVKKIIQTPWILAAASLLLAALGIYFIQTPSSLGRTLWGMAAVALSLCLPSRFLPSTAGAPLFTKNPLLSLKGKRAWGPWKTFGAGAVLLLFLGGAGICLQRSLWIPLGLLVAALGAGWWLLEKRASAFWETPSTDPEPAFSWPEALIAIWAGLFLFYRLDELPNHIYSDSMWSIGEAHQFFVGAYHTPFVTEWDGFPMLPLLAMGLSFKVLGFSLKSGVLFYGLCNLVGAYFMYRLTRFFLPKGPALAGTLLYTGSHWVIGVARMPFLGVSLLLPLETASLFFFIRAVEKGRIADFVWTGTLLALALQTYLPARFVAAFVFGFLVILWVLRRREIGRQWRGWALGTGAFLLCYLPMILYFLQNKNQLLTFNHRVSQVNLLPQMIHERTLGPLLENFAWVLRTFTVTAGNNPIFSVTNWPLLSPWEGLCFLVGLAWCLSRCLNPSVLFLILGFFGSLFVPCLSVDPHVLRGLATAPFTYLLVAVGLDRLSRLVQAPWGEAGRPLGAAFAGLVLLLASVWQYDLYFHRTPQSRDLWVHAQGFNVEAARAMATYPPGWDLYILPDQFPGFDPSYFAPGGNMGAQQPFYPTRIPFVKNVPQKGAVILLPDGFGQAFEGWMKDLYPSAEPKKVLNAFQDVQFWSWEITPDQVQETALRPRTPTTGLTLTAWKGPEKLGEWRIPCLFSGIDYWFRAFAGQKGLPNQGPVRFKIEGALSDPGRLPLRLRGIGPIHGKIGDQWVRVKKGTLGDIKVGAPRKPHARIELTYDCVPSDFNLVIEKKMPEGWRPMPSEDLEPAAPVAGL